MATELTAALAVGAIVHLVGELGAGKTAFVQAAARALGVSEPVTSPTFTVAHLYRGTDGDVAHLDLSRTAELDEERWGDLEPYFDDVLAAFVEWPEAGFGWLPAPDWIVRIAVGEGDARTIEIDRASAEPEVH